MKKQLQVLMQTFPKLGLLVLMMLMAVGMANAATKTATTSGTFSGLTWSPAGVPAAGDDVIVPTGLTVNLNTNISLLSLTVNGTGVFTVGEAGNTTIRTLTITTGGLTVASGATFTVTGSGAVTHLLNISGPISNAGTIQ